VKVVDVQLNQADSFGSSFSFGIDNTGVVQDGGIGVINFGTNNQNVDPQEWRRDANGNLIPAYDEQITITEDFSRNLADNLTNNLEESTNTELTDQLTRDFQDTINRTLSQFGNTSEFSRNQVETLQRALTDNLTRNIDNTIGREVTEDVLNNIGRTVSRTLQGLPLASPNSGQIAPFGTNADPTQPRNTAASRPGGNFNVPQAFLAQIRANISSGNAKILTDPTLVVQEGQVGTVELVENVVTSVSTSIQGENNERVTTPVIEPAGLTLNVVVQKIDDNGFINLRVNPSISAPGNPQVFRSGVGADNVITPLVERTVSSGLIRLRDGQTLILSGIISDVERTQISKVPILGDLPIIGSLFRSTFKDKTRSEVIVMLTPQVIDDSEGYSGFGYNYTPSRETGKYLRDHGLNVPTTPY
jgi:type IV pilus assembly protein PilQ